MMRLLGQWGEPLSLNTHKSLIDATVERSMWTCGYCGFQTAYKPANPTGGLSVCTLERDQIPELVNCISLCDFCVNLNSFDKLHNGGEPLGLFVELPWFKQSHLINFLRIIYCVQASPEKSLHRLPIYQSSNSVLKTLARTPKDWKTDSFNFDGSPGRIQKAISDYRGYAGDDTNQVLYIDRLRFYFHAEMFTGSIDYWMPFVESQVLKAYAQ